MICHPITAVRPALINCQRVCGKTNDKPNEKNIDDGNKPCLSKITLVWLVWGLRFSMNSKVKVNYRAQYCESCHMPLCKSTLFVPNVRQYCVEEKNLSCIMKNPYLQEYLSLSREVRAQDSLHQIPCYIPHSLKKHKNK
jgi:hypothetical protein